MEPLSSSPVKIQQSDAKFAEEVARRSGSSPSRCWHCLSCAAGCPFFAAMDHAPNRILRLIQLGLRKEALESSTIWICVGCHTCSIQCPMAIDMAAIMDALRQIALEENVTIAEPGILSFHREVLDSIYKHGRAHKLEIMLRYKLNQRDLLSDFGVGLKMLAKRKLDLLPSKISDIQSVRRCFHHE
ncbi:MAG: 4Fe-4S dicluster domain-containing protein [Pseudomonadota bacterium]